ncbi:MAG: anthranilate phosphoribosyltransferase, partial [Bacteroidaceae bacterium]|nr:anthranilate phosphoribosyltransferase [Bacteroidaceae bacterium]
MKKYLTKLIEGGTLTREETHEIMLGITRESYNDCQIAALLMAMQTRGVTVDELLGFRDGLLETGKHIDLGNEVTLDIVGTGGDGKNTFNI